MVAVTAISALVVEDPSLRGILARQLSRAGFVVHEAHGEEDAVRRASEALPDVVVLDLVLDGGAAARACARLRDLPSTGDIPILALAGRDDAATKVRLLELGCDEYLVKPYEPDELVARVHALVRRHRSDRLVRRIGALRIDLATGDAWIGARALDLTAGERAILSTLARAYPLVAPRAALDPVEDQAVRPEEASALGGEHRAVATRKQHGVPRVPDEGELDDPDDQQKQQREEQRELHERLSVLLPTTEWHGVTLGRKAESHLNGEVTLERGRSG